MITLKQVKAEAKKYKVKITYIDDLTQKRKYYNKKQLLNFLMEKKNSIKPKEEPINKKVVDKIVVYF
jgi:hypothetical protein